MTFARDPDAFEAFYREHLETVQRFVARRVVDPYVAADLTADVFLAAIEHGDRYRPDLGPPRPWLLGIARTVVAMHHRSAARGVAAVRRVDARALVDDVAYDRLVARLDAEAAVRELHASLAGLPDGQRAVLELVAVDGLTLAEAAAALGISAANARVRYHRARRTLRAAAPGPLTEVTP